MQKVSLFHLFIDPIQSVLESSHQSIIFVIYDLWKETKKKNSLTLNINLEEKFYSQIPSENKIMESPVQFQAREPGQKPFHQVCLSSPS